jgi:mannose/fructose/N-acetylgalactosamine-specific phosphotransferase system component IIC
VVSVEILRLSVLGGLLGLDGTSVGQFMISRPLVAGALTGMVLGDVHIGLAVGAVLELYLLVSFPTGGARFPEGSTATVVAVGTAAALGEAGAVPLGVALGLLWGQLGGATITLLRRVNARVVPGPEDPVSARSVARAHGAAVLLDFLRAVGVTGSGLWLGRALLPSVAAGWPLTPAASIGVVSIGGVVSAGVLLFDLGGLRARRVWFFAGLLVGALVPSLL